MSSQIFSFENNFAHFFYQYSPRQSVWLTPAEKKEDLGADLKPAVKQGLFDVSVMAPWQINSEHVAMLVPHYRHLNFEVDSDTYARNELNIHSMQLGLRYIWLPKEKWGGKWKWLGAFLPTLTTDLDDGFSNRAWQYNGSIAGIYSGEKATWMGGVIYTRATGSPLVLPLFGYHRKWDEFRLAILFPQMLSFHYVTANRWQFGFKADLEGDKIRMDSKLVSNLEFQFSRSAVGADVLLPLKGSMFVNVRAGYLFQLRNMVLERDGSTVADVRLDPSPFIRLGVVLKIPKRKASKE